MILNDFSQIPGLRCDQASGPYGSKPDPEAYKACYASQGLIAPSWTVASLTGRGVLGPSAWPWIIGSVGLVGLWFFLRK